MTEQNKKQLSSIERIKDAFFLIYFIVPYMFLIFAEYLLPLILNIFNIQVSYDVRTNNAEYVSLIFIGIFGLGVFNETIKQNIKDLKKQHKAVKIAVFLTIFVPIAMSSILYYVFHITGTPENQQSIIDSFNQTNKIVFCLATVVFAPIAEELAFRFSLQGLIARKLNKVSWILAPIIVGILFGFLHAGFTLYILYYVSYGLILSFIYAKTDNIVIGIIAHMLNNLIATVLMFV